jgi:hypothetical protein
MQNLLGGVAMVPAAVPQPPTSEVMPEGPQAIFLVLSAALVAVALAYAARRWRSHREVLLPLFLVGGAGASLYEPVVGTLGHMYIPREGAWVAFTFLDRAQPWFVPLAYAGYVGVFAYVAYRVAAEGTHPRRLYYLYGIGVLAITAFETPAVLMDVYFYYGDQPLNLWGLPLWWTFVNPLSAISIGVVVHLLRQSGRARSGAAQLVVAPLMFVGPGISNGVTALPMWLVLNDDSLGSFWQYVAAATTLGLALMVLWIASAALADSDGRLPQADPAPVLQENAHA